MLGREKVGFKPYKSIGIVSGKGAFDRERLYLHQTTWQTVYLLLPTAGFKYTIQRQPVSISKPLSPAAKLFNLPAHRTDISGYISLIVLKRVF